MTQRSLLSSWLGGKDAGVGIWFFQAGVRPIVFFDVCWTMKSSGLLFTFTRVTAAEKAVDENR